MRGFYLAPWWLFVLRGGKRFSLRRTAGAVVAAAAFAELLGAGWRYAFGGDRDAIVHAFPLALRLTAVAAAIVTLAPLAVVARDSLAAGALRTAALKQTSIGFVTWCAAACAALTYVLAPRLPALARVRDTLLRTTDPHDAVLRFAIGSFIVWLGVLCLLRALAIAADGTIVAREPRTARRPQPPPYRVPPTIGPGRNAPPPIPGRTPAPGRIVAKRVDPLRGNDRP